MEHYRTRGWRIKSFNLQTRRNMKGLTTSAAKCIILGDPPGLVSTAFAVAIAVLSMAAKWWPTWHGNSNSRGAPHFCLKNLKH